MGTHIRISAGRGPIEVRRFVDALGRYLVRRGARELTRHGSPPSSLTLALDTDEDWTGTHELVAAMRGRGARKRWFVRVDRVSEQVDRGPVSAAEVRLTASRAGGPGGQNVNKRSTAVRATHAPSGLQVRVTQERSQAQNRALALEKIDQALRERAASAQREAREALRSLDDSLVRGRPAYRWELDEDGALHPA